jgi:hypothetical protein
MAAENMTPEDYAQQQAINRQQQLAAMLMQQGMQQPQSQMVSGRYVAPSIFQNIAPLVQAYMGRQMLEKGDKKAIELAERIRSAKGEKEQKITNLIAGTPDQVTQMAGPYGQGVGMGGANVPMPVAVQPGTKPDLAAALREIGSNNPYGVGKEYKASILSNMIPKTPDAVAQYNFAKSPEGGNFKGSFNDFQNQMTPYQRASLAIQGSNQAQSRVPMGYRMKQDGTLEAIPGGPADQKALTVNAGRETVDTLVTGLKSQYDTLKEGGGITTKENTFKNIPAFISSTGVGQTTGKLFGTQNQSARNTISQSRPLLLQAIKKATGASAKEMDSNVELQMYLRAATDPTLDYEANIYALEQLQTLYGLGGSAPVSGTPGGAPTGGSLPSAADIDAEIARRQNKNNPR